MSDLNFEGQSHNSKYSISRVDSVASSEGFLVIYIFMLATSTACTIY